MEKVDELKEIIANTLNVNPSDIGESYSLKAGKFKTSAGSVILGNIVKKVYGHKVDCKKVSTFGDILSLVEGGTVQTESVAGNNNKDDSKTNVAMADSVGCLACGIDIQEIDIFPEVDDYWTESFYTDNFTKDEIAYCVTAVSPRHSFAARWCVKEALHKLGTMYYDIPLSDIQVVKQKNGILALEIRSNGYWQGLPLSCSLSHADNYAVGIVTGFGQ